MTIDRIDFRDDIHETHITIDDTLDNKFKKLLDKLQVPYEYFNVQSRLDKNEIRSRIGIDKADEEAGYTVVEADTEKLFKALNEQYKLSDMHSKDDQKKFDKFKRFLHTKYQIKPLIIYFDKNKKGEIIPQISNGRHRLVVLRNIGLKTIPVCITKTSIDDAKKSDIFITIE